MSDLISRQKAIDALGELPTFTQDWSYNTWMYTDDVYNAIKQLPPIQPEPHWIPVTERLPEKHGAYIVCYSDFRHGIYYGRMIAVAWFDLGDTWLKYRYADNARTFPPKLHYVIAWMPLPEPYKGDTE